MIYIGPGGDKKLIPRIKYPTFHIQESIHWELVIQVSYGIWIFESVYQ